MANGIITGKEIMDRWGITAFQLQDVLREGELVAVQDDLLTRRTQDADPCLFCDGQRKRETGVSYPARFPWVVVLCEHAPERDVHQLSNYFYIPPEIYQERLTDCPNAPDMVAKPRCSRRWTEDQRSWRIEAAKFLLFELEAYERASGMWQPGEEQPKRSKKQVAQDVKAEREKRIEGLFQKANTWAQEEFINQGRRMIRKELYAFLNSISDESVSTEIEKAIWKRLPSKAKNGPGRRPGGE